MAGILADALHSAKKASLTVGKLLQELIDGRLGVECEAESTVLRRGAAWVLLQRLGNLGAGREHFFHTVSIPVHHGAIPQKQTGGGGVNHMIGPVLSQYSIHRRLTHNGSNFGLGQTDLRGDFLVGCAALQRDCLKELEVVDTLLDGIVDGLVGLSRSGTLNHLEQDIIRSLTPQQIRRRTSPGPMSRS